MRGSDDEESSLLFFRITMEKIDKGPSDSRYQIGLNRDEFHLPPSQLLPLSATFSP